MFQTMIIRDLTLNVVQVASRHAVDRLTGNESRRESEISNGTGISNMTGLGEISNVTSELAQVIMSDTGTNINGLIWALVIAISILAMGCIFCSIRFFEQFVTNPPPRAGASRPGTPRKSGAQTVSATSLCSEWPQRDQPPPASARSHGSAFSVPTSARKVQAGRALSTRIKSNGSSAYGRPDVTPHGSLGMYADQEAARPKAGGSLFAVQVDAMADVNVTGKGSFVIRDTIGGLVLRAALPQSPDGSRKVQVFPGENAVAPCATVEPPPRGSQAVSNSLDIRGDNGVHLGSLVLQSSGAFVVYAKPQPELVIEGSEADVDLHVFTRDRSPKATVSCRQSPPGGPEQVEIHVLPGTDPVLVVACVLAILFLYK